jgi:hypothetical protein
MTVGTIQEIGNILQKIPGDFVNGKFDSKARAPGSFL